jgi:uroporphyrinogen decarboxylase
MRTEKSLINGHILSHQTLNVEQRDYGAVMGMTGVERIQRILRRETVDRIGLFEHFWGDTEKEWTEQGHLSEGENLATHFGFDMSMHWAFNVVADLDFEDEIIEETEETVLQRDGNGAILRRHKMHDGTPEHVDFSVQERTAWEENIKPLLTADDRRIDFEGYRNARAEAVANNRFFCWGGTNAFEMMHPVCGHEYMLMGMLSDPEWIRDMVDTYTDLVIALMETLFEKEGKPDGIWFYEDMGYKNHPFMSPDMYRELLQQGHSKTCDFAHAMGLPVIMHSCGFVEPLLPGIVQAGVDCLQVIEIKAGMDLLRIKHDFGDRIALCGGMDARNLVSNEKDQISSELELKVPEVMKGSGYILHSDHSIPNQCNYETYRYFVDRGLELGTY